MSRPAWWPWVAGRMGRSPQQTPPPGHPPRGPDGAAAAAGDGTRTETPPAGRPPPIRGGRGVGDCWLLGSARRSPRPQPGAKGPGRAPGPMGSSSTVGWPQWRWPEQRAASWAAGWRATGSALRLSSFFSSPCVPHLLVFFSSSWPSPLVIIISSWLPPSLVIVFSSWLPSPLVFFSSSCSSRPPSVLLSSLSSPHLR